MEKPSFVVNGGIKLPIGYRFHPTDEELVVHYLKRKVLGLPLPASVIPELDVFRTDPWSLPGDLKEKRYFFAHRKGHDRSKKTAGTGYWKPVGKDKQIVAATSNQAVGIRKTLVFCERMRSHGSKTQWVMHEYGLAKSNTNQISKMEFGDWVVYSVFQRKKKKTRKQGAISQLSNANKTHTLETRPSVIDFRMEGSFDAGPPQPSSPCLSGVTEVSTEELLDQEETSSSFFSFSSYSCTRQP